MEKNYIIHFTYKGEHYYANVFEVHHSPTQYHISVINSRNYLKEEIPEKLVLKQEGNEIKSKDFQLNPSLLDTLIEAIRQKQNQ